MAEIIFGSEDPESWEIARRYTGQYGNLPGSFTILIRALRIDEERNNRQFAASSRSQLLRLMRGASFKSPVYFAARTFKGASLESGKYLSSSDILKAFSPAELAALMGILCLYRKAKKVCDKDEWIYLMEGFQTRVEVGGLVGLSIDNIGTAIGLLSCALPTLSIAAFLMNDPKGYKEYRRHLKSKQLVRDFEWEKKRWGCYHFQIASSLLVALGFGTDFVEAMTIGLRIDDFLKCPNKTARAARTAQFWADAIIETGAEPQIRHDPAFYPEKDQRESLLVEAGKSVSAGSQYYWLEKGKEDISPEATPDLFDAAEVNASAAEQDQDGGEEADIEADEILEEIS